MMEQGIRDWPKRKSEKDILKVGLKITKTFLCSPNNKCFVAHRLSEISNTKVNVHKIV